MSSSPLGIGTMIIPWRLFRLILRRGFVAELDVVVHSTAQAAFFRFTTSDTSLGPDLPSRDRASAKMASTL